MAYIKTRGEILERYQRRTKRESDDAEADRRHLADAWEEIWWQIVTGDFGIGQKRTETTVATASDTFALPSDFLQLQSLLLRNSSNSSSYGVVPDYTSYKEVDRINLEGLSGGLPQFYTLEIYGNEDSQSLRFWPGLQAGHVVILTYIRSAPSFGDPTNDADDTNISIDFMADPIVEAIIELARLRQTSREDQYEYSRALKAATEALSKYTRAPRARNKLGSYSLNRYRRRGSQRGPVGY